MRLLPPSQREHTAVHEAGHAVAALVLGVPIVKATIVPGRRGHSRTIWGKEWGDPFRVVEVTGRRFLGQVILETAPKGKRPWSKYATVTFAGPLAEIELLTGTTEAVWKHERRRALGDLHRTTPPARIRREWKFRDVAMRVWAEEVFADARCLVAENRLLIRRVADALLDREALSGDDVAAIVKATA